MRAAAETLYIGRIGRGGAGRLGVGPGLLICRLAGRFVERDDALTCLRYVRAGAEVLQICRIGGDGAGLLGIGPGLLVGLIARLLIGCLLLRVCCGSEGWLQADTSAARAMTATIASFGKTMRRARLGC